MIRTITMAAVLACVAVLTGCSADTTPSDPAEQSEIATPSFELQLRDAWVWDMYRPTRFVADVHVVTFKDVNIEELPGKDL